MGASLRTSGGANQMKRRRVALLFGALTVSAGLATGCGSDDEHTIVATPDPLLPKLDADDLFSGELPTFELAMVGTTWSKFRATGLNEEYSSAELRFNGKYLGQVAVRVKGQYSVGQCYPDGELACDKLSLRLKFDAHDEKLRFFGLKRLSLHSLERDVSHIRERLAYDLFRAMDVPASRSAWAKLVVDGKPQGLYSMVEDVDGVFTDDRFDKHGDGDLYKEVWPTSLDVDFYRDGIETNEETADADKILDFAKALTEPEEPADRLEVLGQYMDRDALSRYMAVDDAVANWDGVTTFYADHDGHNHNFFLYVDEPDQEPPFTLIPWDMDNTFQAANWRTRAPGWREQAKSCELTNGVYPPSCDPLLSALVLDQERYTAAVNELLAGPFAEDEMDAAIERHVASIEDAVADDPFGPTVEAWTRDVEEVKRNLGLLRDQLAIFATGETVRRVGVDPNQVNDYSDVTPLEVEMGISVYAAEGVKSDVAIAEGSADEGGLTGLTLAFDMPEVEGGPWVSFALPFPDGETDLRERTGIRFRAKGTNLPGYARLRIESGASTDPSFAWNWELQLSDDADGYELPLTDLFWPQEDQEPPVDVQTWLQHANGVSIVLAGQEGKGQLDIDDIEIY